ncbi:hypothetical protein BV20DRAFT_1050631 [Pilatotrama ljubarskyi]|nr:hypothetical protein BV20DRAFT_1050631 [Pilatotrama ljubarskyi]
MGAQPGTAAQPAAQTGAATKALMQQAASAARAAVPPHQDQSTLAYAWELPSGVNTLLLKESLENEEDYNVWAESIRGALEYATLWDIVSGKTPCPNPAVDPASALLWQRMDVAARSLIQRSLSKSVASAIDKPPTAYDLWIILWQQFSHTSLVSAVSWFCQLVTPLPSIYKADEHIKAFQDALAHLRGAGLQLPEQIVVGIFLSTLVDQAGEPLQWSMYTAKVTLTQQTTLNETVADVRNKRHRILGPRASSTSGDTALLSALNVDTALAALEHDTRRQGTKWCCHCRINGHWASECQKAAGQQQQKKRGVRSKKKKEKANVAKDDDDDDVGSKDKYSHFVRNEHILYTSISNYSARA